MTTAVRIAEKLLSWRSPVSVHNEGQLRQHIVLSSVGFTVLGIWVLWMGHNAPMHMMPPDPDVTFEFSCPPPEARYHAANVLKPLPLEPGSKPAALSNAEKIAHKPGDAEKNRLVAVHPVEIPPAPVAVAKATLPDVPQTNVLSQPAQAASPFLMPAANAATAGGGGADGNTSAAGNGGEGVGAGTADLNSLMGGDFGAQRAMSLKAAPVAMGNIKPYKQEIINRIHHSWSSSRELTGVILEVTVDHNGSLLDKQIIAGTGDEQVDRSLLSAVDATAFPPLPKWFKGNHLKIRLKLDG